MARVTVIHEKNTGFGGAGVLSLNTDNMIQNEIGISWKTPTGSTKIIPYTKIFEIEIHE